MRTLLRKITRFASGRLSAAIAGVCVIGLLTAGNFTETFDTNLYKDDANTTALWDTVPGTLSLFPISMSLVTTFAAGSDIIHVAILGDFAYVTYDGPVGEDVRVVDISNPASPSIVGTLNTQNPRSVTIVGDLAHVADGTTGLRIFNITNPLAAIQIGLYDTPGSAEEVFVSGDHAFVADGDSGLVVVDITTVASPTLAGRYDAAAPASGVEVHGDYAFVATGSSGLEVVDISDPSLPALAGSYDTPGLASKIAIEGDAAYVADNSGGLQVIDVTDPTSPTLMGSYATSGNALDVFVDGNFAYVVDDVGGLYAFDVAQPASPLLTELFPTAGTATRVIVNGFLAFVSDRTGGLQVIQAAQEVGTLVPAVLSLNLGVSISVHRIEISGDYAYIASHNSDMIVVDISNPGNPFVVNSYVVGGITYNVRVSGDYLYIATGVGIEIVDISDPTNPLLITAFAVASSNQGAFLDGDLLYLASRTLGMQIVDVSNPAAPVLLSTYTPGNFYDVFVVGDHAFLADISAGLTIVNVSNPASPTLVSTTATAGNTIEVTVEWDYAYVAGSSGGFSIVDISNLASPSVVATISTAHWAYDSFVRGDRLYIVKGQAGFEVYDITDPTTPTLVTGYDFGAANEQVNAVSVTGDFAFVARAATGAGLSVIRISERGFDRDLVDARSLVVDGKNETILAARLTTTPPVISATFELSADSGSTWDVLTPGDDAWKSLTSAGTELMWRSTFGQSGSSIVVDQLDIEWLNDFSTITSVLDIPGDQGKQARVSWISSGYDLPFSLSPIYNYAVYRRIDSTPAPAAGIAPKTGADTGDYDIGELMRALPPGSWEYLTIVPASGSESYSTVVPTVADSTIVNGLHSSVFFVRALTATIGIHYDSKPDSGYSVDNLAPAAPTGFAIVQNPPSGNQLDWDSPVDDDFDYFRIYRSTEPGFDPMPGDLVNATSDVQWLDPIDPGWQYHYKITTVDHSGNESADTGAGTVTGVPPEVPHRFALQQNHPNPFNPTTRIDFSLDRSAHVDLTIYDAGGRRIVTLVDRTMSAGPHHANWGGRDANGAPVATGVYFYRLTSADRILTRKAVLLK